jgi:hypothetical protein
MTGATEDFSHDPTPRYRAPRGIIVNKGSQIEGESKKNLGASSTAADGDAVSVYIPADWRAAREEGQEIRALGQNDAPQR